jgi:hypothetical protein
MSRRMSPEREREYSELHAYLDFYSTHVSGVDPNDPIHPKNVGIRIVAEYGRLKALDGLKQAVNDTIEELSDQTPEYVQKLDAALRQEGLLTFSEIRRRYASSYKRIVKRGMIRTKTEYYLIAGVLADYSSLVTEDERVLLESLIARYEQSA